MTLNFMKECNVVLTKLEGLDANNLRIQALGQDKEGNVYWYFFGNRLYKEEPYPDSIYLKNWDLEWQKQVDKTFNGEKKKRGRPKKYIRRSDGDSDEYENVESTADKNQKASQSSKWSVVCKTEQEWQTFAERFKGSTSKEEKMLYRTLTQDYLPVLQNLELKKEKNTKKRSLRYKPKRSSARLEYIKQMKEQKERLSVIAEVEESEKVEHKTNSTESHKSIKQKDRRRKSGEKSKDSDERNDDLNQKDQFVKNGRRISEFSHETVISENMQSTDMKEMYKKMKRVVTAIKLHKDSVPFLKPVDLSITTSTCLIVQESVNIFLIEQRIKEKIYTCEKEMIEDFEKIIKNSELYNGYDSEITAMAYRMWQRFTRLMKKHFLIEEKQLLRSFMPTKKPCLNKEFENGANKKEKSTAKQDGKVKNKQKRRNNKKRTSGMKAIEILAEAAEQALERMSRSNSESSSTEESTSTLFSDLKVSTIQGHPASLIAKYSPEPETRKNSISSELEGSPCSFSSLTTPDLYGAENLLQFNSQKGLGSSCTLSEGDINYTSETDMLIDSFIANKNSENEVQPNIPSVSSLDQNEMSNENDAAASDVDANDVFIDVESTDDDEVAPSTTTTTTISANAASTTTTNCQDDYVSPSADSLSSTRQDLHTQTTEDNFTSESGENSLNKISQLVLDINKDKNLTSPLYNSNGNPSANSNFDFVNAMTSETMDILHQGPEIPLQTVSLPLPDESMNSNIFNNLLPFNQPVLQFPVPSDSGLFNKVSEKNVSPTTDTLKVPSTSVQNRQSCTPVPNTIRSTQPIASSTINTSPLQSSLPIGNNPVSPYSIVAQMTPPNIIPPVGPTNQPWNNSLAVYSLASVNGSPIFFPNAHLPPVCSSGDIYTGNGQSMIFTPSAASDMRTVNNNPPGVQLSSFTPEIFTNAHYGIRPSAPAQDITKNRSTQDPTYIMITTAPLTNAPSNVQPLLSSQQKRSSRRNSQGSRRNLNSTYYSDLPKIAPNPASNNSLQYASSSQSTNVIFSGVNNQAHKSNVLNSNFISSVPVNKSQPLLNQSPPAVEKHPQYPPQYGVLSKKTISECYFPVFKEKDPLSAPMNYPVRPQLLDYAADPLPQSDKHKQYMFHPPLTSTTIPSDPISSQLFPSPSNYSPPLYTQGNNTVLQPTGWMDKSLLRNIS